MLEGSFTTTHCASSSVGGTSKIHAEGIQYHVENAHSYWYDTFSSCNFFTHCAITLNIVNCSHGRWIPLCTKAKSCHSCQCTERHFHLEGRRSNWDWHHHPPSTAYCASRLCIPHLDSRYCVILIDIGNIIKLFLYLMKAKQKHQQKCSGPYWLSYILHIRYRNGKEMMFHFSHTSMYPSSTQLQRATFMKERMKPMFSR